LEIKQAEVNIGIIGHVDHGKTSLVKAITGEWVDKHSEEIKRGITIRLGYADAKIYYCDKCKEYFPTDECEKKHKTKFMRKVSFVDCPGHENLMAVTISGASLMDGAILVIAANEECPQPQTQEHINALDITKIKNVVIVQNKVDLVSKEDAKKHYNQIKEFVRGTVAENAVIIPVSANYNLNISYLLKSIEKNIPTQEKDIKKFVRMYVARSFDINKPGVKIKNLKGGVIGGSLIQGELKVGDIIEISPGVENSGTYESIQTEVTSLSIKEGLVKKIKPGGLVAIGTKLDPSLTKNDRMVGNVAGKVNTLPGIAKELKFKLVKFERILTNEKLDLYLNDMVIINAGTAMSPGTITSHDKKGFTVQLKRPFCVNKNEKISISKKSGTRWVLIGYGEII